MQKQEIVKDILFDQNEIDLDKTINIVQEQLNNMDDGELFLEYSQSESLNFDDGVLKNSNYSISSGFGFRSIIDDVFSYSHSSNINYNEIIKAGSTNQAIRNHSKNITNQLSNESINSKGHDLYSLSNPLADLKFLDKIAILQKVDHYLRNKNQLVKQVSASISGNWQIVAIIDKNGKFNYDIRPLVRMNISVIVEKSGRMESGSYGCGGRNLYNNYIGNWREYADKALSIAINNLDSVEAPAGSMKVVLGSGWPGILLHEAIGHGLEGDFNRKKTSVFSGLLGEKVAAEGVTIIDDGTIDQRRGSINIDDEGNSTNKTILIEDGILKTYIQDKMNAKLMNREITGNGRRENYMSAPMPRMTNTYMINGKYDQNEIIESVDDGLYAANFGGGQVDITSGKFVFSASEAYLIKDGKITHPVKGATIIGSGSEALKKITMIGNDMELDHGIGTCGKSGQSVPVGVGQPSLLIDSITVGGTKSA